MLFFLLMRISKILVQDAQTNTLISLRKLVYEKHKTLHMGLQQEIIIKSGRSKLDTTF